MPPPAGMFGGGSAKKKTTPAKPKPKSKQKKAKKGVRFNGRFYIVQQIHGEEHITVKGKPVPVKAIQNRCHYEDR